MQDIYLTKQVHAPEGTLTILNDMNLKLKASEVVIILGVSGASKSTLLRLLGIRI